MRKDRRAEDERYIREKWFPNHVAEYQIVKDGDYEIEVLRWAKPGTGFYAVHYWYRRGTLCVIGDCGDAVFQWNADIGTLRNIAQCSLDYFAGKCQASPYGRGYETWNADAAKEALDFQAEEDEEIKAALAEHDAYDFINFREEWAEWLQDFGYEVFGDVTELYGIGMEIDIQCRGLLIGLKMAFEQLDKAAEVAA